MERIQIFDATLREGAQAVGALLDAAARVQIARQLARLGVDAIEVGFPAVGPHELEAVRAVAQQVEGPVITALARASAADVDSAWAALRAAARPRIQVYIPTSDSQIEQALRSTRDGVRSRTRAAVARAKSYVDDVEFSPMDATQADVEFTAEVIGIAIEEGATVINVADTFGAALPHEFAAMLGALYRCLPALESVVLAVHCHNDLGLAVANSVAGVQAGARQVECTVNGIGPRAGNAPLEEIVMVLELHGQALGVHTGVDARELTRTSRLVSLLTGYPVQPNKPIVGRQIFAGDRTGGRPGRGRSAYGIIDPTAVGAGVDLEESIG